MPNSVSLIGTAALVLTGALLVGRAQAADLDPPYGGASSYSEDRVEFGSGWYIRGDLGATNTEKLGISDVPAFRTVNADGTFNPSVNPQAPALGFTNSNSLGYDASIGAGYQINRWLRTDVVGDFHKPVSTSGTGQSKACQIGYQGTPAAGPPFTGEVPILTQCAPTLAGKLQSYDVLFNAYVDLGTWYHVTPYVGAGAGISFGHYSASSQWRQANNAPYNVNFADVLTPSITYNENWDRSSSGTYYNFAWALMAGAAIDIYDHTKLDVGYRYLNLGKVNGISNTLYSHEVRAGVRYMIDD